MCIGVYSCVVVHFTDSVCYVSCGMYKLCTLFSSCKSCITHYYIPSKVEPEFLASLFPLFSLFSLFSLVSLVSFFPSAAISYSDKKHMCAHKAFKLQNDNSLKIVSLFLCQNKIESRLPSQRFVVQLT